MTCPKCGKEIPEGKKFCGNCGTKIETANTADSNTLICSSCGAPLTPGKKFCGKCGAPVSNAVNNNASSQADVALHAGFAHWNILPGQLAAKIDETDLEGYKDIKGLVIQDGLKALFFADGKLAGELQGGKYPFTDMIVSTEEKVHKFFRRLANFFKGKSSSMLDNAASIIVVLLRDAEFPLIFMENDIPTAGLRTSVAMQGTAKITNVLEFYHNQLLDRKMVTFQDFAAALEPMVHTILSEKIAGIDADSVTTDMTLRATITEAMQKGISSVYSYISFEKILRLTATNEELEAIRQMREELYLSEKELIELSRRNNFLNRLNDEKNQQLLQEAQTAADFANAMFKIDQQNELTEDEKAKFADMLYWQRKLREATSRDEGEAALNKLEQNGLLREEELSVLKADIDQRAKIKNLTDGQALAMLTLQNEMALDEQKLQWELQIGNKRFENQMNRQRMQDEYADERRRREIDLDKEEQMSQLDILRQAQALRAEREDAEHRRKLEEEKLHIDAELEKEKLQSSTELEKNRIYAGMSAEQIMAANPNISEHAAAALAEKFKGENSAAYVEMANKHSEDIERIMSQNAEQQNQTMQQMMQMMGQMFSAQNTRKDAEIDAIRKDAETHQDRMQSIITSTANAAYGAAGKIFSAKPEKPEQPRQNNRKDAVSCPKCGAPIEAGESFCGECGTAL
ncbi:MAG: zinc-ribbon domain-containing protein [Treponema sp.]|nr:zinc-ribbon domain-containing protein [Treponema sp.]